MIEKMKTALTGLFEKKNKKQLRPFFRAATPEISQDGKEVYLDVYGRPVPDADVQFYPPKVTGLSVFEEEAILKRYHNEINELYKHVKIGAHRKTEDGTPLFEARYISVIRNLASYTHMLPASENHHHSQPGGLFRHSLEAGLFALQYADNKLPPTTGAVDRDEERRPRYIFAAWLGGLLHDLGKVITDIRVHPLTVFDGEKSIPAAEWPHTIPTWKPRKMPLTQWAKKHNVERYSIHFVAGRHKKHEAGGAVLLRDIIEGEALDFIEDSPDDLPGALHASLSGYLHESTYLSNAIRYGDALSVKNDSKFTVNQQFGTLRHSKKSKIIGVMRSLRNEWGINHPKAQLWVIGEIVYLRWESAFHSIIKKCRELHIDDVARDTASLLEEMNDLLITKPFDEPNQSILFCEGEFEIADAIAVAEGEREVQWVELVKVHYKEWVFNYDPIPPCVRGIIFLQATNEFLLAFENGTVKEVKLHSVSKDINGETKPVHQETTNPDDDVVTENRPELPAPTEESVSPKEGSAKQSSPQKNKKGTEKSKKKSKQLSFVNAKQATSQSTPESSGEVVSNTSSSNEVSQSEKTTKPTQAAAPSKSKEADSDGTIKHAKKDAAPLSQRQSLQKQAPKDESQMLVVDRVSAIANSVGPVKNHKHAVLAEDCSQAWGLSIKDAGLWLKSEGLLKASMQSMALTFLANNTEGKECKYFALTPKVTRYLNSGIQDEKKAGDKSNKPKSILKECDANESTRPREIQLRQLLSRSPKGTIGNLLVEIIGDKSPASLIELEGGLITFDLFNLLKQSQEGRVDLNQYEIISESLKDWEVNSEDPLKSTVITVPIEALKKVKIYE